MTTIAYCGSWLACDTKGTDEGAAVAFKCKIRKISARGELWGGFAGSWAEIERIIHWIQSHPSTWSDPLRYEDRPQGCDAVCGIIVEVDDVGLAKRVFYLDSLVTVCEFPIHSKMAVGSGTKHALGAMYAGATATQAVDICRRLDNGSGGDTYGLMLTGSPISFDGPLLCNGP